MFGSPSCTTLLSIADKKSQHNHPWNLTLNQYGPNVIIQYFYKLYWTLPLNQLSLLAIKLRK